MSTGGSAYKIACVTCAHVATVRTQLNIPAKLMQMSDTRSGQQKHLVDSKGFAVCDGDTMLFTICWPCEKQRAEAYGLPLMDGQPGDIGHARLANPYISRDLVESWPLIQRLANDAEPSRLGTSREARPILKIELLSRILEWTKNLDRYEVRDVICYADTTRADSQATYLPEGSVENFLSPWPKG